MEEKDPKDYRFLEEKTKDPPRNRKKFIKRLLMVVILAAVFGAVACLVFYLLKPAAQKLAEKTAAQQESADGLSEDASEGTGSAEEAEGSADAEETEDSPDASEETGSGGEEQTGETEEEQELTLEDYETFRKELYSIGKNADASVVVIETVTSRTDWFEDDYETTGAGTGIIIQKTSDTVWILTDRSLIEDASEITVTFYGSDTQSAQMAGYDSATGIAVLSVARKELDDDTDDRIEAVSLENTTGIRQGMSVIAIGSPQGSARSVVVGTVTSISNEISVTDANYRLIGTDITTESNSGGVLLNTSGEAVGLICRDADDDTLQAYVFSELSDLLDRLKSGSNTVQLGIKISEVTSSIASDYDLPEGVYIKEVETGSPAAEAGLQVGDVIVKIGSTEILSESSYEDFLLDITKSQTLVIEVMRQGSGGEYQSVTCRAELTVE